MRPPRRLPALPARAALAAVLVLGSGATLAACSGDEGVAPSSTSAEGPPSSTGADDPLQFVAYVDPAVPITAAIGERFALMLDAEPSQGLRWQVEAQADPAVALPLGSQFLPRDSAAIAGSTTTTAPPPDPLPAADGDAADAAGDGTEGQAEDGEPSTAEATTTTTTPEPTSSVQVLSYVGRSPGTTTVSLRYVRVDGSSPEERTVTFTITVIDPAALAALATVEPPPAA